ncbi:hypothetical protein PtrV1_06744 [Pyrenophora tritici-repentis]|nr:hypothetical protein PtrV1_06744 [Pyrenophora tritici-repentis]
MDNLMHSTTEEIAAWIRTIELPPGPNPTREELGTFYEDETIARAPENGRLEYDEAGRKVVPYPTPPHTPPPAALLAQMLTNVEHPFRDDDTGGYGLQSEETAYGKQGLDTSYGEHGVQTGAQREHGLSAGVPREQCDAGGYGLQSEETAYGKQGLDTSYGEHGVQTGAQREHGLSAGVPREQCDAGGYGLQSEETAYGKQGLDTSYGKQGLASGILHPEHRMLKEPWAAAFMAGTKAGNVQNLAGERLDKAKLERMMRNGKKPHRSQLPPPPQANGLREDHELTIKSLTTYLYTIVMEPSTPTSPSPSNIIRLDLTSLTPSPIPTSSPTPILSPTPIQYHESPDEFVQGGITYVKRAIIARKDFRQGTSHIWKYGLQYIRDSDKKEVYYCHECRVGKSKQELFVINGTSRIRNHLEQKHQIDPQSGIKRKGSVRKSIIDQQKDGAASSIFFWKESVEKFKELLIRWIVYCHIAFFQLENQYFRELPDSATINRIGMIDSYLG